MILDLGIKPYYSTTMGDLYHADCGTIMSGMPEKSVDLTITSPPYDNLRSYNGFTFDFENIAKQLYRVTKIGGVVVWVVGDQTINGSETGTSFKQALYFKEIGFNLHDTMIWHKSSPPLTHNRYEQHFEYMFVFSKEKPKTFNPIKEKKLWEDNRITKNIRREKDGSYDKGFIGKTEDKIKGNVWSITVGGGHSATDDIAYEHPAIFPEKLALDHILSWSNKDDIIYDPFMGSGTVAKMCEKFDRKWIGTEISEKYCELSAKRIEQFLSQGKLF
jgi:DNA modification methylase